MNASDIVFLNQREYELARRANADRWVPACGGNEVPYLDKGKRVLYVYNHRTGKHGYLDLDSDIVFDNPDLTTPIS